jgi:hypothetical protein
MRMGGCSVVCAYVNTNIMVAVVAAIISVKCVIINMGMCTYTEWKESAKKIVVT